MSKKENEKLRFGKLFSGRIRDLVLFGILGFVLFYAAWNTFRKKDSAEESFALSDTEVKVMRILEQIDGVGEADVVVYEAQGETKSVVVVCEGANDLRVVMNVREAVAAALDTQQKSVKVYLKKE